VAYYKDSGIEETTVHSFDFRLLEITIFLRPNNGLKSYGIDSHVFLPIMTLDSGLKVVIFLK